MGKPSGPCVAEISVLLGHGSDRVCGIRIDVTVQCLE
ncbi:hypothetical protein XF_0269 [Xylella fastidiosa 9a5c]|uniref:Uncharacterized protein n=1 Tax=Xylella fastidiosa (strain 9a5c) TaxID=160492 RepID=Q9PGM9_XYLFA|nr:hypothetical protein XF_0269 [Xylella fastidiosa 9a5c]